MSGLILKSRSSLAIGAAARAKAGRLSTGPSGMKVFIYEFINRNLDKPYMVSTPRHKHTLTERLREVNLRPDIVSLKKVWPRRGSLDQ